MTLRKHPEVLALAVIVVVCGFASRRPARPEFRLSSISQRVEERSALAGGREQCAVERLQSRIDAAISRMQQRVEQKQLRVRGL